MNKLKVFWFPVLIFIGWFISLKIIQWISAYPVVCDGSTNNGVCVFLFFTGLLGIPMMVIGCFAIALYLQD